LARHENTRNRRLLELLGGGCSASVRSARASLSDLPQAMEIAAAAGNLESIVIRP
jgi:hypothetical protein